MTRSSATSSASRRCRWRWPPACGRRRWTFDGQDAGRRWGRVGDVFEITLINDRRRGHSVDFHAGAVAPDEPMRTVAPGETLIYPVHRREGGHLEDVSLLDHADERAHRRGRARSGGESSRRRASEGRSRVRARPVRGLHRRHPARQRTPRRCRPTDRHGGARPRGLDGVANQYDQRNVDARVGEKVAVLRARRRAEPGVVVPHRRRPVRHGLSRGRLPAEGPRRPFGTVGGGAQALALQPARVARWRLTFAEPGLRTG